MHDFCRSFVSVEKLRKNRLVLCLGSTLPAFQTIIGATRGSCADSVDPQHWRGAAFGSLHRLEIVRPTLRCIRLSQSERSGDQAALSI